MAGDDNAVKVSSSHSHYRLRRNQFPVGSSVEVRTHEEGFKNVFFSATVVPPPPSKGITSKIYVEYKNLLAREGGSDPLIEDIKLPFLRPPPPSERIVGGFEPDDAVEAFYNDGWWIGVVSRVVEGGEKFIVTFKDPPDVLEFGPGELRPHWDWVNGIWVRPQSKSRLLYDVGRRVEVSFDRQDFQDAWFPATIQQNLENGDFLVEYNSSKGEATTTKVDSLHIRCCPPILEDKNHFTVLEKVDAFFDSGWWSGVITKELENSRYLVYFKQMKLDKVFDQSELRPHMEWKEGEWLLNLGDRVHENHSTPDENSAGTGSSINGETLSSSAKRRPCLSDSGSPLKKLKFRDVSTISANDKDASAIQNTGDPLLSISSSRGKHFRLPKKIRSKRVGKNVKRPLLRSPQEEGPQELAVVEENQSLGQEERQNVSEKIQDSVQAKTNEVEKEVAVPGNVFDGELVQQFIKENDSASLIQGSRPSPPDNGSIVPSEMQSLPFEKQSSVWQAIESMEIFQRIPQKPHFQPLEQFHEGLREGMAIGYMINFANLIGKILRLELDDLEIHTDEMKEILADFEKYGFDVSVVKDCIAEFLSSKDEEKKLVSEVKDLNNQLLECNRDKSWIEEDWSAINNQIRELEEKLSELELSSVKKDEEIASLEARLVETEEKIKNGRSRVRDRISSVLKVRC